MARVLLSLALLFMMSGVYAQPAIDAFSKCVTDNTSGRDRKDLARWMFVAIGMHPEMKEVSSIRPEALDASSRKSGALFTRLIADVCTKEAKAVVETSGSNAYQSAFSLLGKLAMMELMTDPDVNSAIALFQNYIDNSKIQRAIGTK